MAEYTTILVGTDGSDTSFRAVERAAAIARDASALLVIACAFHAPKPEDIAAAERALGDDAAYIVRVGPADEILLRAKARAHELGAKVETVSLGGKPGDVLITLATERNADLVVVGNRGLNTLAGRLLGSVPQDVIRHAAVDVLVVHTTA